MRLPDVLEPPPEVVVCKCCWCAGCWQGVERCGATVRDWTILTAEQVKDIAFESPSFWHGLRAADQPPRDLSELLDVVQYASTRPSASRSETRHRLVVELGIDADQVDAALAQAWAHQEAS